MKSVIAYADWLSFRASDTEIEADELCIYDQIGRDWNDNSGVQAKVFREALGAIPKSKPLNVRINSPGGNVWDGFAIHNMLEERGNVSVFIDGVAASIASVIAMAGDTIYMPENALMMIHMCAGVCMGASDDMRKMADVLDKHSEMIADTYSRRTGQPRDRYMSLMQAETWMDGLECKGEGLCDILTAAKDFRAKFDLSKFKCAPSNLFAPVSQPAIENDDEMPEDAEEFYSWAFRKGLL